MTEPIIDPAVLDELKATAGAEFVAELATTFFEEAPQMLAELRIALQAGDAERYRRAAHSLKSNSNTFGAMRLGAVARVQELAGLPEGGAATDAIDAIETLEAEFRIAEKSLRELIDG